MKRCSAHISGVRRGHLTVFVINRHVLIQAGHDVAYILHQLRIEPLRKDKSLLRARRPKFVGLIIAFVGLKGLGRAQTLVPRATHTAMLAYYRDTAKGRSGLTGAARKESPKIWRFDRYRLQRTLHYQGGLAGGDQRPGRIQLAQLQAHQIPVPSKAQPGRRGRRRLDLPRRPRRSERYT
jgi:hypothetical protein